MSTSIHFQAIIPVDGDTYRKHKAVIDACEAAGVPVPTESAAFFGSDAEDQKVTESGIYIDIRYGMRGVVTGDTMRDDGSIIDLAKLPPGTTKIRVYAS